MTKLYLSYSRFDLEIANILSRELIRRGYEVVAPHIEVGEVIIDSITEAIRNADVFLVIISNETLMHSKRVSEEIKILSELTEKLVIPIYGPNVELKEGTFQNVKFSYYLNTTKREDVVKLSDSLHRSISSYIGTKTLKKEREFILKQKRDKTAHDYISETLSGLVNSKKRLNVYAQLWYILGYITLLAGIIIAGWFMNFEMTQVNSLDNVFVLIFYAIKNVIIIILFISSSKYSFNLAKSYMNESLKIAERIHAISFGKFYLQVFDERIEPDDLKEVFRDWNISSSSSFKELDAADFDPKLLDGLTNILNKIKDK